MICERCGHAHAPRLRFTPTPNESGIPLHRITLDAEVDECIANLRADLAEARADLAEAEHRLEVALGGLRILVNRQAEDEGLWFITKTASEAYLQHALRTLHDAIEQSV